MKGSQVGIATARERHLCGEFSSQDHEEYLFRVPALDQNLALLETLHL